MSVFNPTQEKLYRIRESIMSVAYRYEGSLDSCRLSMICGSFPVRTEVWVTRHDGTWLTFCADGLLGSPTEMASTWRRVVFVVLQ